jgi:hypothetical protein
MVVNISVCAPLRQEQEKSKRPILPAYCMKLRFSEILLRLPSNHETNQSGCLGEPLAKSPTT